MPRKTPEKIIHTVLKVTETDNNEAWSLEYKNQPCGEINRMPLGNYIFTFGFLNARAEHDDFETLVNMAAALVIPIEEQKTLMLGMNDLDGRVLSRKFKPVVTPPPTDATLEPSIPQAHLSYAGIQKIPWKLLFASPLDPRKTRSEAQILELADSIFEKGMLQNITARAVGERFEIAAGNTRYLAVGRLIAQGRTTEDYLIPVQVRDLTDRELLEIALTENSKRTDMHPLEDCDAYAELERMGATREEIAARVGKSIQTVHRRIALSKLETTVRTAFLENKINTSQAEAFTIGTLEQQKQLLKVMGSHGTIGNLNAAYIRNQLTEKRLLVKFARFDLKKYQGEITEDLFGEIEPFFTDAKQAEKLQRIEAAALVEHHQTEWAWAKIVESYSFSGALELDGKYTYLEKSQNKKKAGVIIQINPRSLEITELVGYVIPDAKSKAVEKAERTQAAEKREISDIHANMLEDTLTAAIGQPVKISPLAQAYLEKIPKRCEFDPYQNTRRVRLDLLLKEMRPQVARVSLLRLITLHATAISTFSADVPNPRAMDGAGRFWLAFDGAVFTLGLWGHEEKIQDPMPTSYDKKQSAVDVLTDAILDANKYAPRTDVMELLHRGIRVLMDDYEQLYLTNNN